MPLPFPGMDPYLEAPDIWPDFHDVMTAGHRPRLEFRTGREARESSEPPFDGGDMQSDVFIRRAAEQPDEAVGARDRIATIRGRQRVEGFEGAPYVRARNLDLDHPRHGPPDSVSP